MTEKAETYFLVIEKKPDNGSDCERDEEQTKYNTSTDVMTNKTSSRLIQNGSRAQLHLNQGERYVDDEG